MKRTMEVNNVRLEDARIQNVIIEDQVRLGPVSVGNLKLDSLKVVLKPAQVSFENVSVDVTLTLHIDWAIDIGPIPLPPGMPGSGTIDLPSITGHLAGISGTIPDISPVDKWEFSIQEVDLRNISLTLDPLLKGGMPTLITNIAAKNIEAGRIKLPSAGFSLDGLGLGSLLLQGLSLPDIHVDKVRVGSVLANDLQVPWLTLTNIALGGTSSIAIGAEGMSIEFTGSLPRGKSSPPPLVLTPKTDVKLKISIGSLRLIDAVLTANVGSVRLENARISFDAKGIRLEPLDGSNTAVDKIEINP